METMLIQEFRADHQRIRGTLLRLHRAILEGDVPLVRTILGGADTLLGAHFKFEERYLYPALSGFLGDDGVRQMLREHDSIFRGVGDLIGLAKKPAWAETERAAALESLGLVGDHPENCDNLCRFIEGLPATQQEALLAEMRQVRQERPEFSAYGIERQRTSPVFSYRTRAPHNATAVLDLFPPSAQEPPQDHQLPQVIGIVVGHQE